VLAVCTEADSTGAGGARCGEVESFDTDIQRPQNVQPPGAGI
jgi:hypothetical protein